MLISRFRRSRWKKQENYPYFRSMWFEKCVQIVRTTFSFFTLVTQSFALQLQSKDFDLDHEGNWQLKVFLSLAWWFLHRKGFIQTKSHSQCPISSQSSYWLRDPLVHFAHPIYGSTKIVRTYVARSALRTVKCLSIAYALSQIALDRWNQ